MTIASKTAPFEGETLVYIRHMEPAEIRGLLPPDALAEVDDPGDLFVVASADGQRIAIVEGRDAAFAAARAHDLKPLSVH